MCNDAYEHGCSVSGWDSTLPRKLTRKKKKGRGGGQATTPVTVTKRTVYNGTTSCTEELSQDELGSLEEHIYSGTVWWSDMAGNGNGASLQSLPQFVLEGAQGNAKGVAKKRSPSWLRRPPLSCAIISFATSAEQRPMSALTQGGAQTVDRTGL